MRPPIDKINMDCKVDSIWWANPLK